MEVHFKKRWVLEDIDESLLEGEGCGVVNLVWFFN